MEEGETHDGGALQDGADHPNEAGEDDGFLASDTISKLGDHEGADEGARRHGCDHCSLGIGVGL